MLLELEELGFGAVLGVRGEDGFGKEVETSVVVQDVVGEF